MSTEPGFEGGGVDPRYPLRIYPSTMHPGGPQYGLGLRGLTHIDNGLGNTGGGGNDRAIVVPGLKTSSDGAFVLDPFAHLRTDGSMQATNLEAQLGAGMKDERVFQAMSAKHAVHRTAVASERWDAPLPVVRDRGDGEVLLLTDQTPEHSGALLLTDRSAGDVIKVDAVEIADAVPQGEPLPPAFDRMDTWIPGFVDSNGGDGKDFVPGIQSGHALMAALAKKAVTLYVTSGFLNAKNLAKGDKAKLAEEQRAVFAKLKGEAGIKIRSEIARALHFVRNNLIQYQFNADERNVVISADGLSDDIKYFEDALREAEAVYAQQQAPDFVSPLEAIARKRAAVLYGTDASSSAPNGGMNLMRAGAVAVTLLSAIAALSPQGQRLLGFTDTPGTDLRAASAPVRPAGPIVRVGDNVVRAAPLPPTRATLQAEAHRDIVAAGDRVRMVQVGGKFLAVGRTGIYRISGSGYELERRYRRGETADSFFAEHQPTASAEEVTSLGRED